MKATFVTFLGLALLTAGSTSAGSYVVGSMNRATLDAVDIETFRYEASTDRLTFWVLDVDRTSTANSGTLHDYTLVKQSTVCGSDTYRIEYLAPYKFGRDGPLVFGAPTLPDQQVIPGSFAADVLQVACSSYKSKPTKTIDATSEAAARAFRAALNEYLEGKLKQ